MQRTYRGVRRADGGTAVTVDHHVLAPRQDLRDYSPAFEWDASEAGPSQLALAILADYLGDDERALSFHQEFKRRVIRGLPTGGWTLVSAQIDPVLKELESTHAVARLEKLLGHVVNAHCRQCGRRHRYWAPDRTAAQGHYEAAGWIDMLTDDGHPYMLCGDCHASK